MQLPDSVFAEGMTFLDDGSICLLTWRENTAFIIDPLTMEITEEFPFDGEGWGICAGEGVLFQSDGSDRLIIRSQEDFEPLDTLRVILNGEPQHFLNELEFAYGCILANQWRTTRILFINPETGVVERLVSLRNVTPDRGGVMNGLAADDDGRLFCTGKNWPVTLILDNVETEED